MNPHRPLTAGNWQRSIAWAVLLLCSLIYVVRGFHDERLALYCRDFKTVYAGARCLLQGCDPYDSQQLLMVYTAAGGPANDDIPFHAHESIYTPSGLALLTPFAALQWRAAEQIWLFFSTGVFLLGSMLIAQLCLRIAPLASALGIGLLLLTSTTLIMLGQPSQLTIGFCAIGVWCLLEDKFPWAGVVCFALSLALKPHVAGAIWLYFAICAGRYRRQALRILAATVLICLPGILWATLMPASSHWLHEIQANIAGITARGMPGDPGPADPGATSIAGLQTILSLFRDQPAFYNRTAQAIGLVLLAAWMVPVVRVRASRERDYLAIASMACLSLLPIYHREYDTRILLLAFPAFAMLMRRELWFRIATAAITVVTLTLITHNFINYVTAHVLPGLGPLSVWGTIFWLRPVALWTLVLTLFYLGCFYARMLRQRPTPTASELSSAQSTVPVG